MRATSETVLESLLAIALRSEKCDKDWLASSLITKLYCNCLRGAEYMQGRELNGVSCGGWRVEGSGVLCEVVD